MVPIRLPPLRERPADIPVLIRHFLEKFSQRLGRGPRAISHEAERALIEFDWPGNIRQLENIVERMVLLVEGDRIELGDLPENVREGRGDPEAGVDTLRETGLVPQGKLKDIVREATQELERDLILRALQEDDWNVTHTARRLGISRKGLQLKMKDYGLREEGGDA